MIKLEALQPEVMVRGLLPDGLATIVSVHWHGPDTIEITYKNAQGGVDHEILYRDQESELDLVEAGRSWSFDGDGQQFRLISEALRIRLAYLFDSVFAVHASNIEPLPHQGTGLAQ